MWPGAVFGWRSWRGMGQQVPHRRSAPVRNDKVLKLILSYSAAKAGPFPVVPLASFLDALCFVSSRFCRPYGTGFIVCDLPRTCVRGCILSPLCGWGRALWPGAGFGWRSWRGMGQQVPHRRSAPVRNDKVFKFILSYSAAKAGPFPVVLARWFGCEGEPSARW